VLLMQEQLSKNRIIVE
ncbi:DNA-directed RNA polymerase III RPC2, partial [Toxoplasma gondii TgCatPRC2]